MKTQNAWFKKPQRALKVEEKARAQMELGQELAPEPRDTQTSEPAT